MYNQNDWKVITNDHITFVEALKKIEKLNKRDKKNTWRLPTLTELQELPEESQYMDGLNLGSGLYWVDLTNQVDEHLQAAGFVNSGGDDYRFMNIHKSPESDHIYEEVSLVVKLIK